MLGALLINFSVILFMPFGRRVLVLGVRVEDPDAVARHRLLVAAAAASRRWCLAATELLVALAALGCSAAAALGAQEGCDDALSAAPSCATARRQSLAASERRFACKWCVLRNVCGLEIV